MKIAQKGAKMILAYTGTPGSGKSYHAAVDIWDRVRFGHPVITNIPMQFPKKHRGKRAVKKTNVAYNFLEMMEITPKYLTDFSEKLRIEKGWQRVPEDYIFLVIDEAQLIFNCRDWNARGRMEWIKFFQLHRKLGYRVILITQVCKMLDNQMRGLIEYEILHRKASNFGLKGWLVSAAFLSPSVFIAVRMWAVLRERVDCKIYRYSRKIARMYDTNKVY